MLKPIYLSSFVSFCLLYSIAAQSSSEHDWSWPYKRNNIEIMNNLSALQFYGPFPGFHHGLDLLADGKEKVYAPASGKVGTRYYYKRKSPYTYEVFIELDDGYRIELHHIDIDSIPPEIEALAKSGGRIEKGRYLGTIFDSSKMNIPPHLHTNLKTPDGYYANPLWRYPKIVDKTKPVIEDIFVAVQNKTGYIKIDPNNVLKEPNEPRFLIIRAHDLIANSPNRLGLYKLGIFINNKIITSIQFDQLPQKRFTKGAEVYLAKPISIDGKTIEPGNMNKITQRHFFYKTPISDHILGANKKIIIRVEATDFNKNKTSKVLNLEI